ncbi:sensor histidine kinase, partial [Methanothrix sp.]|uniref:sensor histidine kinase n=1 Tax=Methanothrix sp. TaxID=90426 RepID=UPI0034E24D07
TLLDIQAAAMILLDTKTMRPNRVIHRWFELTDEAFNEKIKNAESALKDTVVDKAIACRKLDTSLFGIAPDSGSIYAFPVLFEVTPVGILLIYRRSKADIRDNERLIFRGICNALGGYLMKDIVQKELDRTRMQREELLEQLQKVNEELKKAQEETNLYLDIMAHDINNANTAALGYGEFLIETLGERERELAKKMLIAVKQSTEIIKNVSTIRKLRESKQPLQPVELEGVIRSQMNHYPEAKCTFAGTTAVVMADDLLGEVFNNLIGNSVKFGGAGVQIEISVMDRDEYVEVTVADTGPGIPDEQKPLIFTRFGKGKSKKSGKGLGLFICRMLIERYGGRIWAEDRVIGSPEQGAAIKFTLQKARVPAN